jgi:adenine-specific DNA-methyltransferase
VPGGPRLELTWPNKDQFLLVPKDDTGKPVWVSPDHPAATEVRVPEWTGEYGDVHRARDRAEDNLLFTGDSLHALRALNRIPELAREYRGKVKLVYLDPPFNTQQTFRHYDDWMEHSTWLSFMQARLTEIKSLLSRDGTVWIHLDDAEIHRMRCLLDEVFGSQNYLATVVWQRTTAKSLARNTMGTLHESILVYGASESASLKPLFLPLEDAYVNKRYANEDKRGRFDTGDLTATSHRPHLDSGKPWRGHDPSERRRCWAVPRAPLVDIGLTEQQIDQLSMREKLDVLDDAGYIYWPPSGGFPRFKKYLHKAKGRAIGDLWTDIAVINSQALERSGFSTQKPEALLRRVIEMASAPGEIVLDVFAGSGTTAATAHKLRRRWVTAELSESTANEFTAARLRRVTDGTDGGGISEQVDWTGGGGFRTLAIGASMYEVVDGGAVFLAEWATNGKFSEAVAAQLGFDFEPNAAPFSGTRGRMRLAVFDGVVGPEEVSELVGALGDKERVTVVAQVVLDGTEERLKELSPGSRVRKAPRDLLHDRKRTALRRGKVSK